MEIDVDLYPYFIAKLSDCVLICTVINCEKSNYLLFRNLKLGIILTTGFPKVIFRETGWYVIIEGCCSSPLWWDKICNAPKYLCPCSYVIYDPAPYLDVLLYNIVL